MPTLIQLVRSTPTGNLYATDKPDEKAGNACHEYTIENPNYETLHIHFQHGPVKEVGVNGIPDVLLGEVIRHRLEAFQESEFACKENAEALKGIITYLKWTEKRTADRMARMVEGKNAQ